MPISGQKTVTAAGTAVALGSQQVAAPLMVKALSANTGLVFLGNDGAGDVSSANGMQLAAGEMVIFNHIANLSAVYLDSAVNGEGVCWLILEV